CERRRAVGERGGGRLCGRRAGAGGRARAGRVGRRPRRGRAVPAHERAARPCGRAAARAAGDRVSLRVAQRHGGRLAGVVGHRRGQLQRRYEGVGGGRPTDRAGRRLDRMSVRVGTCSWADDSLSKLWYPPGVGSAEARLRFYAEHFDTVEVNSSYYALPTEAMAAAWAERTPPGFVFHVKAFGMMTRHPVRVEQLPPDMRSEAEFDERGRIDRPSRELRSAVFRRFLRAVESLREAREL